MRAGGGSEFFRCVKQKQDTRMDVLFLFGAGDEARTRYLHLGKVALYQMSYARGTIGILSEEYQLVNTFLNFFQIFLFR